MARLTTFRGAYARGSPMRPDTQRGRRSRSGSTLALWAGALWLLLTGLAQAAAPAGQYWNSSYQYRRQLNVPVTGASALQTQYALSVSFDHAAEVTAGRSLASGNDVRVVLWNGSAWVELDRVLDPQSAWNSSTTRLWFRTTASLPGNATDTNYYLYFGNAAALTPPQDTAQIFSLYDAFSSTTLSGSWTATGSVSIASGVLTMNSGATLASNSSFGTDTIWEARLQLPNGLPNGGSRQYYYWLASSTTSYNGNHVGFYADSSGHHATTRASSATNPDIDAGAVTVEQIFSFTREGSSSARFLIDGVEVVTPPLTSNIPAGSLPIRLYNNANGANRDQKYDWMRVRPYRNPEPALSVGALEAPGGAAHFVLSHDNHGINCLAETIGVSVRDAANNPLTSYNQQITLDTGTGKGTWTKLTGSGTFPPTTNNGVATYQWPAGESSATFSLSYTGGTPTFHIDAYQTNNPTIRDDDPELVMTFAPSGFTVTAAALSNPPPASIAPFTTAQIAGTAFDVYIAAYGQTPTDSVCGIIEDYAGDKSLAFTTSYVNPVSGTRFVTIDSTQIPATRTVSFSNGQAKVTAKYKDVGRIAISMADGSIAGSTGNLVLRPANFVLSNILANPGASDATGARFVAAGDAFTATLTVLDSEGAATPNFGKESPAHTVELLPTLIAPTGGTTQNPGVSSVSAQVFNAGVATATFSWPEVGIIRLTPHVAGSSYLGAGDVTGTTTGNVGRFYPKAFALSANTPVFQTACTRMSPYTSYTYMGEPLNFSVAPLITATALAAGGTTTKNYTGTFGKVGTSPLALRNYAPIGSAFTLDQVAPPQATIGPATAGVFTILLSSTSGMNVTRTTPRVPFDAAITLSVNVSDLDDVTAAAPLVIGAPSGITFTGNAQQRYGRLAFRNTVGSERVNLPMTLATEFFLSDNAGFVRNVDDICSSAVTVSLLTFAGNLSAGETCVQDSGQPGLSGAGCNVAAPLQQRFRVPPTPLPMASVPDGGDFNLWLSAPGAGNDGTVTLRGNAPPWLQFDWDGATPGILEDPRGIATFGIFQGSMRRLYQRERVR